MIEPGSEPAKGRLGVCVLVVATTIVVLALARLPLLRGAENWLHDIRLTAFSPSVPLSADVVLVTIDEETLATLPYRTPVDRGLLADLISALDARGARAIGLDLLLDQPTERERDLRLREVLDATRAPVVLASTGLAQGLTEVQAAFLRRYTRGLRQGPALVDRDPVDGTVRRIPLVAPRGAPTFVAELARVAGVTLPASDAIALNYPPAAKGVGSGFSKYAARWVASAVPDAWIRDRIVLIGVDLLLEDRHRTPFAVLGRDDLGHMPGVEIHAFALQQLLDGARERVSSPWLSAVMVALAAALGAALGIRVATARGFAGVQVLGGGGFLAAAFALSSAGGPVVPVVGPLLAFAGTSAVIMIRRWYAARKHAAFLTSAFSRYVAPTIVEQLVAHPEKLRLNGERRELTFLFTDVAGFTTLTESMPAEQLVAILNEYIDGVCRILIDDGGTIEKIVGDAVHVMFNAPLDQPDHAPRAVRCAMKIDAFCRAFERRMHDEGIRFGETRIGVNTGETVVGNMGGSARFDYSATGDAINVAARLESANRHLGTRICVGDRTRTLCPDMAFRPIGVLTLKGKSYGIQVFEPVPWEDRDPRLSEYLEAYRLMQGGDACAAQALSALAGRNPDDRLVAFHAARLAGGATGTDVVLEEK